MQVDRVWQLVFDQAFDVGALYCERLKLIPLADCVRGAQYLRVGLLGATFLEALLRSLKIDQGIALADGHVISARNCPAEHKKLLDSLLLAKAALSQIKDLHDPAVLSALRTGVVSTPVVPAEAKALLEGRSALSTAIVNAVNAIRSIAQHAAKLPAYEHHFGNVIALLSSTMIPPPPYAAGAVAERPVLDAVWKSFFNQAYSVAEECVRKNLLTRDDLKSGAPFLYLGIPALTVLLAIERSARTAGIVLAADGVVVTADNCPEPHRAFLDQMLKAKTLFVDAHLAKDEFAEAKKRALFKEDEDKAALLFKALPDKGRDEIVDRVVAATIGVAVLISQLAFYKEQFNTVIELLEADGV